MIQRLIVKKLNGRYDFDLEFHSDLNVITGKNGSGKTTLLKLVWYLMSGRIFEQLDNISFQSVYIETDQNKYEIVVPNDKKNLNLFPSENPHVSFSKNDKLIYKNNRKNKIEADELEKYVNQEQRTLFFPTFRRIEGGFHIDGYFNTHRLNFFDEPEGLNEEKHQFIAANSTEDIVQFLTLKYAEISDKILTLDKLQSDFVLGLIEHKNGSTETQILESIQKKVQDTKTQKENLLRPFTKLSQLIQEIYIEKGIQITESLMLGETKNAILSDKLSAGEKQMLAFLAYGMFAKDTLIFIDEPELSLHTDWQELLLPTLMEFDNGNQFFVATHSPFIYYRYPDKEIELKPQLPLKN